MSSRCAAEDASETIHSLTRTLRPSLSFSERLALASPAELRSLKWHHLVAAEASEALAEESEKVEINSGGHVYFGLLAHVARTVSRELYAYGAYI